jgi:cellulose biosynthesis protein BcsQ
MKTIAAWTIKGGVGKTAAAVNLAHASALRGNRTLLWDLDPQAATSFYLRVPPGTGAGAGAVVRSSQALEPLVCASEFDNLFILPADLTFRHLDLELGQRSKPRRRLRKKLKPLGSRFDVVLIDCAPSLSLVSEAVIDAADALLVPVIPSTLSMRTLDQVRRFVAATGRRRPGLLPFLSMVDRRKTMHRQITDLCLAQHDFLRTVIPTASVVEKMGLTRAPVAATLPSHPVARAFTAMWGEIEGRLGTVGS